MILKAYNKSEIARIYFQQKGEFLTNKQAANRWRMINPDCKLLREVFKELHKKQLANLRGE
jgi:hypothetical protein